MGNIRAILFDLGDTLIAELDGPADIDNTEFEVLDGVYDVLNELRGRFRLAIVSNTYSWGDDDVSRALARRDLAGYFDAIVTSVDADSMKPDDGIFKKVLGILDIRPQEAVMIGDRVDTDIAGANLMGITSVLCRWNERYPVEIKDERELPDYVISSIRELLPLLNWLDDL